MMYFAEIVLLSVYGFWKKNLLCLQFPYASKRIRRSRTPAPETQNVPLNLFKTE